MGAFYNTATPSHWLVLSTEGQHGYGQHGPHLPRTATLLQVGQITSAGHLYHLLEKEHEAFIFICQVFSKSAGHFQRVQLAACAPWAVNTDAMQPSQPHAPFHLRILCVCIPLLVGLDAVKGIPLHSVARHGGL